MDEKMDLKRFLNILKKRIFTVVLTTIALFGLTVLITIFVIKPTYEATEYVLVGKLNKESGNQEEVQDINRLLASSIDFMKSPIVLDAVKKELNINKDKLEGKIVVQNSKDSQIINIVVRDSDPKLARQLAHITAVTSVEKMNDLFKVQNIQILSNKEGDTSIQRVSNPLLNMAIGLVVGLFLGIGLAMFKEYLDDSVKSSKEIEYNLGLEVLGHIHLKGKTYKNVLYRNDSKSKKVKNTRRNEGEISV